MNNRLITVFGGAGFVGRHLVRRLAAEGCRIRVVSRTPALCGHLQPLGDVGQIVVQSVDLTSEEALTALLRGTTAVVNLIGCLHETSRQSFDTVHGELPGRIARAAAAAGVGRMVQVSAIGAAPDAGSAYARSKAKGEAAVRAAMDGATVIRPSIIIGPEDTFFNRFASLARISPVLPLIGGGKTKFQPIYVADVAAAITTALGRENTAGRTFEIGGPQVYSFEALMRYMLEVIDRRRLLVDMPFGLATFMARWLELLPAPLLTRDQVDMLKHDNVVGADAGTLTELDVMATPIELIVPTYLARYRTTPARTARS